MKSTNRKMIFGVLFLLMGTSAVAELIYPVNSTNLILPTEPRDIHAFFFDLDDNVWRTQNKFFLIHVETGEEIGLTTENYAEIRDHFSEDGRGLPEESFVLDSGERIQLSDYEINFDLATGSFRQFADLHGEDLNYLLQGINYAQRVNRLEPDTLGVLRPTWQGPSYDVRNAALEDPWTTFWTFFPTARMNNRETIHEAMSFEKRSGDFAYLPPKENIWPVKSPEFARYFREAFGKEIDTGGALDASAQKVLVMSETLDIINQQPPVTFHRGGFSDDDYGNFSRAAEDFKKPVAEGRWPHIRLTLFYTGRTEGQEPHALVLSHGQSPKRLPLEQFEDVEPYWHKVHKKIFGADTELPQLSPKTMVGRESTHLVLDACAKALQKRK